MSAYTDAIEKRWPAALFGILVVALAVRLFFYVGYQGADDRNYVAYAVNFASSGDIAAKQLADPWIARIGAWIPMGLLIMAFGLQEWVLTAYSLACSLAGIAVAMVALRRLFDTRLALVTAALLAIYPNDVLYATRAFGDEAVGFWCALAFFLCLVAERSPSRSLYVLTGIALGTAYLAKETAVLLCVPMAILWWTKRSPGPRMLAWMAFGFLAVLALEFAVWQSLTDDPLYRWRAATGIRDALFPVKQYRTLFDYIPGPLPGEVFRSNNSVVEAALMFTTNEEFGFLFYIVFPVSAWVILRRHADALPLAVLIVSLTLLQLFFPLQFPTYTLNRDPRYYTPLSAAALGLLVWWAFRLKPRTCAAVLAFVVLTWIPCLYIGYSSSDMSLQREVARFVGREAERTVWMSNRMAADVIVLGGNVQDLRIGVHWIGSTPPADGRRLANSAIRAMRPATPAVREAAEISEGYVILDGPAGTPLPEGWVPVRKFQPVPGRVQLAAQRILQALHAPKRFVELLAPSHGASAVLYRVG